MGQPLQEVHVLIKVKVAKEVLAMEFLEDVGEFCVAGIEPGVTFWDAEKLTVK